MNGKYKQYIFGWLAVACLMLLSGAVMAQQEGETPESMTPEQAAMMEAWTEAMTPGPEHERLAEAAGEWQAEVKWWMEPGSEPSVSESSVTRSMSLEGRVLVEEWQGEMMGQPFIGHGRTGYDNVTGKYWSTWTDNMSTGLMMFEGRYDAETGKYTFTGSYTDPMSGDVVESRSVSWSDESGREIMEMYETRGGREIKTMEMTLVRR
ncbi:MAG: DUF1579 domain-containing protein [Gammaproteobacteria bacterium]|jgi:hypothetical protein|nr:DUF1579 domain-containing protein [Gammaproteobacteria bacterium]